MPMYRTVFVGAYRRYTMTWAWDSGGGAGRSECPDRATRAPARRHVNIERERSESPPGPLRHPTIAPLDNPHRIGLFCAAWAPSGAGRCVVMTDGKSTR